MSEKNTAKSEQLADQYYKEIYGGNGENAKELRAGDKVYIINVKEGCTPRPSGKKERTRKSLAGAHQLETLVAQYVQPTDVWSISFSEGYESKNRNERYIRFQYDGSVLDDRRRHMAIADYTSDPTIRMAGTSIAKDWAKRINMQGQARGSSIFTSRLRYGTPYIITSEEALSDSRKHNIRIQMSSTSNNIIYEEDKNFQASPGTEYWMFLPASDEYMKGDVPILCRFARSFKGDYFDTDRGEIIEGMAKGRCGQDLIDICAAPMNRYCGDVNNTFKKKTNCFTWLKDNPNGLADPTIRRICRRDNESESRECGCVGPIEKMDTSTTPDKNRIEIDWTCYGEGCVNNLSAWKLEQQQKSKCPSGSLCIMKNIKTEGGGKITYGQACSSKTITPGLDDDDDDDDDIDTPTVPRLPFDEEDEGNNTLFIVLGVGFVITIGIIIFFLVRNRNKKKTASEIPPQSTYPGGSYYYPSDPNYYYP